MEPAGKQEKTKYKLAASMKECMKQMPVDKITVKNIVEGCGVARQTFYRSFLDKYDLINWYFDKLLAKSFEHMGRGRTVYDALVKKFTHIQEEIRDKCHEELFTLIMRRFMMRIAEKVAVEYGCGALITGESLGQVASQTMPAMAVTGAVCELPVFRPCIGMDKEEIVRIARKIDTFETSILPYEDCCTVFTPKHPNTKPKMPKILEAESNLDVDTLVDEAVKGVEIVHLP